MPVPVQTPLNSSVANGATSVFPYSFLIFDEADLQVKVDDVVAVLNVDYTVDGVGSSSGGNVTFISGNPANGVTVVRRRMMAYKRDIDYQFQGDFLSAEVNPDQDAPVMMIQQLATDQLLAVKIPESLLGIFDPTLPTIMPLQPLVPNAAGTAFEFGDNTMTGDMLLRGNLASPTYGESLVFPSIDVLSGIDPTGATLSDAGFAAAAALGRTIRLTPGATYYLSMRVAPVTGTRFVCDGMCTIKIKTGAGGFDNVILNGAPKDANAVFWFNGVDDFGIKGVEFILDGTKEVAIWPIRVLGGCALRGCDFERIRFKGLSMIAGGYLTLNTIGEGGYRVRDIEAINCGTALGNAYWTGTPQITVFDIDNDMIGGVPSAPGYGSNIRGTNVLLTGTALANYGQQTDIVNVAGISGTDRKGPTIHGVYADGVGEVIDIFCTGATITGIRARNVHMFVAKFIHGARHNYVEVDAVESCGAALVSFAGSSAVAVHTEHNVCRVRTAKGLGDAGDGPITADTTVVLMQENGGTLATCLPRNNLCEIDTLVGGANLDYVVRDNCSVNNTNNNLVRVTKGSGWQLRFSTVIFPTNTRARYLSSNPCRLSIGANQTLSTAVAATVQYQTVQSDIDAISTIGSYKISPKFPGWYNVRAQVRLSGNNSTDYGVLRIQKNAGTIAQKSNGYATSAVEVVFDVSEVVYIGEDEVGAASADLTIQMTHTGAATVTALNTATMSYFEVSPIR